MLIGLALLAATAGTIHGPRDIRDLIPAFARRYRVGCSHCHVAFPKLNAVGEAFRLNGYRFPEGQPVPRGEPPIPLGEEPWKDLWPRAIWPGELPASVPLALRIGSDLEMVRGQADRTVVNFRFPEEVYLLAGGSLGAHIGGFIEAEWNREEGPQLLQAKVFFGRLLTALGKRAVNLQVGLQNLYLFTFADQQIDRVARQEFLWQGFSSSQVPLPGAPEEARPTSTFHPGFHTPAIEVNGLLSPRFYYGIGVSQGAGELATDNNRHKDVYLKLRVKAGGMALDGSADPAARAGPAASFGRLPERAIIAETFGYLGSEPMPGGGDSPHRTVGVNIRALVGSADLGLGYVWGRDDHPWGSQIGSLTRSSLFAKGEYQLYPWLIASLKGERFAFSIPSQSSPQRTRFVETHLLPGLVALVRQNVRLVAEADLFPSYQHPTSARAPGGAWLRLDVAF